MVQNRYATDKNITSYIRRKYVTRKLHTPYIRNTYVAQTPGYAVHTKVKFNTNTDTSLIRNGNVVGTSHVRDLHTSLEQTDTAQNSAYHRYASDTPQIREYVTKLLFVTFTRRIRSTCCVAFLYML